MSNSTACIAAILSWVPRTVKIMTILVTGATGNIGRRIVDHLIDLGANDIRALATNPARAKLPDGVTAVTGLYGAPLPERWMSRSSWPHSTPKMHRSRWMTSPGWPRRCWSSPMSHTSAGCIRSRRAESAYRSATSSATGPRQKRRSKRPSAGTRRGISTRSKTHSSWGSPAQSVVQWAGANAELFR